MTKCWVIQICGLTILLSACTPYRVEYRPQSPFERSMGAGFQDDVHLEDGTVIRFSEAPLQEQSGPVLKGAVEKTKRRTENEDGTVELRSPEPIDLINHLMSCLRMREYQLIWEQLIAEPTLQRYAERGHSLDEFSAVMEERRIDLGRTLTRIQRGLRNNEAQIKQGPGGSLRIQLQPSFAANYRYTKIDVIQEDQGNFRLLRIQ